MQLKSLKYDNKKSVVIMDGGIGIEVCREHHNRSIVVSRPIFVDGKYIGQGAHCLDEHLCGKTPPEDGEIVDALYATIMTLYEEIMRLNPYQRNYHDTSK